MSVDVEVSTDIARPRAEVAAFAADPDAVTRWYANIRSVEWQTPRPVQVGTEVAFVAQFLGRRLAYTYRVEVLEPDERLVMRTEQGPFPMETTYRWADAPGGGTRMWLRNRGAPAGLARVAGPVMGRAVQRATRKDLAALKALLESGAA